MILFHQGLGTIGAPWPGGEGAEWGAEISTHMEATTGEGDDMGPREWWPLLQAPALHSEQS